MDLLTEDSCCDQLFCADILLAMNDGLIFSNVPVELTSCSGSESSDLPLPGVNSDFLSLGLLVCFLVLPSCCLASREIKDGAGVVSREIKDGAGVVPRQEADFAEDVMWGGAGAVEVIPSDINDGCAARGTVKSGVIVSFPGWDGLLVDGSLDF